MISRHGIPTWSPGAHLGVVWPHGVALVSDDLSPELGGELWQRVHASTRLTDFVRALAEVAGVNVLELPEFAVAIREGESWHLAVRGEMQVEVQYGSAAEVLRCRAVTTWTERTVHAPTAIRVGDPVWATVPVSDGVVLAGCIEVGTFEPLSTGPAEEVSGTPAVDEGREDAPELAPTPAETVPEGTVDHAPIGCLRILGNELIPLGGPVVIGRHPGAAGLNLSEPARLVTIAEPHISANHLALFVEDGQAYARDLGSRNGSALRRQGGEPLRLPERSIPLQAGDVLDLGQGVLIHCDGLP